VLWANYQKLKTNIVPVPSEEQEFKLVSKYLRQTHAPSHSKYSLELMDLFKIEREGELDRFEKWSKLHNRMVRMLISLARSRLLTLSLRN
jgi:poly [ADP-ribose] polymerase